MQILYSFFLLLKLATPVEESTRILRTNLPPGTQVRHAYPKQLISGLSEIAGRLAPFVECDIFGIIYDT